MVTLLIGGIFILLGIAIDKFKYYGLITIFNTKSMQERSKYNVEKFSSAVAILSYYLGILLIIRGYIQVYMQHATIIYSVVKYLMFIGVIFFVFETRKKKYLKNNSSE